MGTERFIPFPMPSIRRPIYIGADLMQRHELKNPMATKRKHPLGGLMAFVGGGEWRHVFSHMLGAHLGPTLDAFELTAEDLIHVLGKDRIAKLWGCILEDLIAQHDGLATSNIVDDYLRTDGRSETMPNRAYMLAVRQSVMSLYEVVDVAPGEGLAVWDAIRDLGPLWLHEESRTHRLDVGDWFAGRLVPDGDGYMVTGSLLSLTAQSASSLLSEMRDMAAKLGLCLENMTGLQLRQCTCVFIQAWLIENLPATFD